LSSNLNRKPIFARLAGSYQNTTSDVPTPTPLWWNRLYAPNGPGGNQSLGFPALMANAAAYEALRDAALEFTRPKFNESMRSGHGNM